MKGGSNIDGDESGGTSPSWQGAGTGILVPRSLLAMAAEIGIASGKSTSILGVSTPRAKYRRRGCRGDPPGSQEASWCVLGWGRARDPPGLLVVAPLRYLGDFGSFRVADFLSDFSDFLEHF